jgi:exodeoxyribonuclease VII large subunit
MVETMHRAGMGDILARLDALRRALAAEGLFDPERKRPLPRFPGRVVVITSDKGAALRDILNVLGRRNSGITVTILPAAVQGVDAPAELVARLLQANRRNLGDVIIIGRGGGSIEDLLAFSDERVVRAVAASRIPVISAVGHETDVALTDFAADYRAPTPSAAAELVSESRQVVIREILQLESVLGGAVKSALQRARTAIARFEPASIEAYFMRKVSPLARREAEATEALGRAMRERLLAASHRLAIASEVLHVASPEAVLGRGFSLVRRGSDGRILRSTEGLVSGDSLDIRLAEGSLEAEVKHLIQ